MMMVQRSLYAVLGGVLLFGGSLLADEPVSNAALKYWQAFSTIPRLDAALEEKLDEACREAGFATPVDPRLKEWLSQSEYSLRALHHGAAIEHCDWGVELRSDGAETLLPHIAKARTLARLALLRARQAFEQQENEQAARDVVAATVLARHVSQDGTLIGLLVGYSIEMNAMVVMAAYLPQIDSRLLQSTVEQLGSAPKMGSMTDAIASEEQFVDWAVEKLQVSGDGQLIDLCMTLTSSKQDAEDLLVAGGSREQFIEHLLALRPLYAEMQALIDLPQAVFRERNEILTERLNSNPIARFAAPGVTNLYTANAAYRCRLALWDAAVAMRLSGPDALASHLDPYGDGPFVQIAETSGRDSLKRYRLRSRFERHAGAPVELYVGAALR